jgi:hypothetical protein
MKDTRRWKYLPCSWTGRNNVVKCNIQIQSNPHKISSDFPYRNRKNIQNFIWKLKRHGIVKASLSKRSIGKGITKSDFKLYNNATVTKTKWYSHKTVM